MKKPLNYFIMEPIHSLDNKYMIKIISNSTYYKIIFRALKRWQAIIIFLSLASIANAIIVSPIIDHVKKIIISSTGQEIVANEQLLSFAFSIKGLGLATIIFYTQIVLWIILNAGMLVIVSAPSTNTLNLLLGTIDTHGLTSVVLFTAWQAALVPHRPHLAV